MPERSIRETDTSPNKVNGVGIDVAVFVIDNSVGVGVLEGVVVKIAVGKKVSVGIDVEKDMVVGVTAGVTAGVQEPSPIRIANSNCFFNFLLIN